MKIKKTKLEEKNSLVTIYIVSKNYGRFLKKSIQSVLNQSYKNWELFVVDDNSKDETYEIMREYNKNHRNR